MEDTMPDQRRKKTVVLMADDDEGDCLLMKDAVREVFQSEDFHCLSDGVRFMDYLLRRGVYADIKKFPLPDLILLDLNMPWRNGYRTLKEIRAHQELRAIPILTFSTAKEQESIEPYYKLGADSYITEPMSFENLIKTVKCLSDYWFGTEKLPPSERLEGIRFCSWMTMMKMTASS
jgi:CheY-like chemotaxis protein